MVRRKSLQDRLAPEVKWLPELYAAHRQGGCGWLVVLFHSQCQNGVPNVKETVP